MSELATVMFYGAMLTGIVMYLCHVHNEYFFKRKIKPWMIPGIIIFVGVGLSAIFMVLWGFWNVIQSFVN